MVADEIVLLTARDGSRLVREGALKPSEWLQSILDWNAKVEPYVHTWEAYDPEIAKSYARALDQIDWTKSKVPPLLAGAPIGIKDCMNTADYPTGMGSRIWSGSSSGNDARIVANCNWAGGYTLGKTVTAEFAVHTLGNTTINAWNSNHIPGTSSTGSAVGVACGQVPVALGTQAGGSITRPASYNGVLGFKPSFGIIPRTGVLKTSDTLDTIGWFARCVDDLRSLLEVTRVHGRDYPVSERGFEKAAAVHAEREGWKLALLKLPGRCESEQYTRNVVQKYAEQCSSEKDLEIIDIDLSKELACAHDIHRILYHKSLSYYFYREQRVNSSNLSSEFLEIIEEGRSIGLPTYQNALDEQRTISERFHKKIQHIDAIIAPSVYGEAPLLDEKEPADSALIWTLLGVPSLSIPLFTGQSGMPFGLQLVGARYSDYQLLDLARRLYPGDTPLAPGVHGSKSDP